MIDTIVLRFDVKDFIIIDHDRFTPSTKSFFVPPYVNFGGSSYIKAVCNPRKSDLEKFGYLPCLTMTKAVREGGYETFLRVEFSAPKLLWGNNFDELDGSNFEEICSRLEVVLSYMGVTIPQYIIAGAKVSAIHYGKNIVLTDFSSSYEILREIAKVNVSHTLDLNHTDFRNGGHSLKFHSNTFEIILYDKLKDLKKAKTSEKRAIENENYIQLSLFDNIVMKKPFEVIRIEIRLGNGKKIKSILQKYGYDLLPTFKNLFSVDIAKRVVLENIKMLEAGYPNVSNIDSKSNEELFVQLMMNNPQLSYAQLLSAFCGTIMLNEVGTRTFRTMTEKYGNSCWYRHNKIMKGLKVENKTNIFSMLIDRVNKFEKVALVDYKDNIVLDVN